MLGFPTYQTFEQTSYESICSAFLSRLMMIMKTRKQREMEAREQKVTRRRRFEQQKEEESWRVEVVHANEAFQVKY